MESIKVTAKRINEVSRCWVKNGDNEYFLHDCNEKCLPSLAYKFSDVLRKLNIGFRSYIVRTKHDVRHFCFYYDKDCFKQRKEELPVYEFSRKDKLYHYLGMHQGMVPTEETIQAAKKLVKKVDDEMEVFLYERDLNLISKLMNGKEFIFTTFNEIGTSVKARRIGRYYIYNSLNVNGNENGDVVIFDVEKVAGKIIEIELPNLREERMNCLLGRDNCNMQRWADECGIDKMYVTLEE